MRSVLAICLLSLALPVLASNPGEPLDCSDFVFLIPGLSCTEAISNCVRIEDEKGNTTSLHDPLCFNSQGTAMDPEGHLYRIRWRNIGMCNGDPQRMNRVELLRTPGATAGSRCVRRLPLYAG